MTTPNLSGSLGAVGSSLRLGPLQPSPELMSLEQWVSSQTRTPDRRYGPAHMQSSLRTAFRRTFNNLRSAVEHFGRRGAQRLCGSG